MKSYSFMAFAKGQSQTEITAGFSAKRYIGYAAVNVLAVNPTKEELEKIYNNSVDSEPEYHKVITDQLTNKVYNQMRIDFIVKVNDRNAVNEDGSPIDMISRLSFFIRGRVKKNKTETKIQVIDKYGRTAWVTKEQFEVKAIPVSQSGKPLNIDSDYRATMEGEEELTTFIKAYLGIQDPMIYNQDTGMWEMKPEEDLPNYECRFENMQELAKGKIKEIKDAIAIFPKNVVGCLFGVRTADNNMMYQDFYKKMFFTSTSLGVISRLTKEINNAKASGAYPSTSFEIKPLHEYKVNATKFDDKASGSEDMPDFTGWGN